MTGASFVTASLARALTEAGLRAVQSWERLRLPELETPAAVVGVAELTGTNAALWDYLGLAALPGGGTAERYGRRLSLEVFVDIYAPRAAAEACGAALETVEGVLLETGAAGLRVQSLKRGALEHDRTSGYLKCRCTAAAEAYLTAARVDERAELTDFELKGVVKG